MGFVRISGGSSGGGSQPVTTTTDPRIIFDRPIAQYQYSSGVVYSPLDDNRGFSIYLSGNRDNDDSEGLGFPVVGLNPLKSYNITYTIRASINTSTSKTGASNAVGFCQGFYNFKSVNGKRTFNLTKSDEAGTNNYKQLLFPNCAIGGLTNYTPFNNVTTNPVEYNLKIKKGCDGIAFLCFEVAYPNNGDITYYFEDFSITTIDEITTLTTNPVRLNYSSATNKNIRSITTITNLPTADSYEVIKLYVKGKCSKGTLSITTNETGYREYFITEDIGSSGGGSVVYNGSYTIYEIINHVEELNKTFIMGEGTKIRPEGKELKIEAAYYPDRNSEYSDDYVEIYYEITGSASVEFTDTYSDKGDELSCSCESQQKAEEIANELDIEFEKYEAGSSGRGTAYFYTAERFETVRERAWAIGIRDLWPTPSSPLIFG